MVLVRYLWPSENEVAKRRNVGLGGKPNCAKDKTEKLK